MSLPSDPAIVAVNNAPFAIAAARLEADIESRRSMSIRLGWIDTTTQIASAAAIVVVALWIVPILSALD